MSLGEWGVCDGPILEGGTGAAPIVEPPLDHWVTIQETVVYSVKVGSISCELVLNGKGSFTCILINPAPIPQCGQVVKFIDRGKLMFGGFIQTVTLNADQAENVKEYTIDCAGWEGQLERHLIKSSYTNQVVQTLIPFAISDGNLDDDGFVAGIMDPGPPILALVDADYVRASEYLRDVATAGGGAIEISPEKVISFHTVDLRAAPFPLISAEPEYVQTTDDLDDYCNQVTVLVTGTGGATSLITRADPAEIAFRQSVEGGSGIYHVFERITHPTSNDVVELGKLGVSVAFLMMQARTRLNRKLNARLRRQLLEVGQLLTVNMPGMNLDGVYQINRMTITDEERLILFDIEATFTNKRQLNLDSLLKIVGAAKTTIVIPTDNFTNTATFTTPGSQNWNVPGTGTVQVEVDALGAGGGGGGGSGSLFFTLPTGGIGGAGGKGVSLREYAAGTTLTIVVGTGGAGGVASGSAVTTGGAGGSSYVSSPTESRIAEGLGGGGGITNYGAIGNPGITGAAGQATGDYRFPGSGSPGGAGLPYIYTGANGINGVVIIRY